MGNKWAHGDQDRCSSGARTFSFWVLAAPQPVLGEDFRGLYRADHTGAILCGDATSRVVCLGLTANNTDADSRLYAHSFEQVDEVELHVRPHHGDPSCMPCAACYDDDGRVARINLALEGRAFQSTVTQGRGRPRGSPVSAAARAVDGDVTNYGYRQMDE